MNVLALLLTFAGFVALCLGMDKHYKEHVGPPPSSPLGLRLLRGLGWICLALSFTASVAVWGWQIGPLLWFGWLSIAGYSLVFAKPWLVRRPPAT